jgi:hypothetical protein
MGLSPGFLTPGIATARRRALKGRQVERRNNTRIACSNLKLPAIALVRIDKMTASTTSTDFIKMSEQVGGIFVNPCGASAFEFLLPIAAGQ